jgi:hypothetical protein
MKQVIFRTEKFDEEEYFEKMNKIFKLCAHNINTFGFVDENDSVVSYASPDWVLIALN